MQDSAKKYRPEPGKIVVVPRIPECNFCTDGTPGPYDFKTQMGPWANGCEAHWEQYRTGLLGVGSGQLWITDDQVERNPIEQAKHDAQKQRAGRT
jgi:hypothetical protein